MQFNNHNAAFEQKIVVKSHATMSLQQNHKYSIISNNIINLSFKTIKCHYAISYFFKRLFLKDFSFKSKTRRKPGVWYGFQKPALVLANDVILLATPCLSEDCTKCVQWIESQLSASQPMFSDYELRLWSCSFLAGAGKTDGSGTNSLDPNILCM